VNKKSEKLSDLEKLKIYLKIEEMLTSFFNKTGFCSNNCFDKKTSMHSSVIPGIIGCCDQDYFDYVSDFDKKFPLLRKLRLETYGTPDINIEKTFRGNACRYHTKSGCILKKFKPIPCLTWICDSYKEYLLKKYSINYNHFNIKQDIENFLLNNSLREDSLKLIKKINNLLEKIK